MLEGGEQVVQVGRGDCGRVFSSTLRTQALRPCRLDACAPLAVTPVEQQDRIACRHTQHIEQVIGLAPIRFNLRAGMEGGRDKQALRAEVVGHQHALAQAPSRLVRKAALSGSNRPPRVHAVKAVDQERLLAF
jgi:hypothetical protein